MCQRPSAVWMTPLASPVPPAAVSGWKVVVVLKDFTDAIKKLEEKPKNLYKFAEYADEFHKMQNRWTEVMEISKQEVEDMYITLRSYQVITRIGLKC